MKSTKPVTLAALQSYALEHYRVSVVPQPQISIAESLIAFWDRPWSGTAKRFAYHALVHARARGLEVLDP